MSDPGMLTADFRRALAQHAGAEHAWLNGMRCTEHPERWLTALHTAAETHTLVELAEMCGRGLRGVVNGPGLLLFRLERAAGIHDDDQGEDT